MNSGRRLIGFLTGHRLESRILIVFLISAALAFGLGKLASEVIEGDTFALDRVIIRSLRIATDPAVPIAPRWFTSAMIDVTALGSVTILTLVTLFAAGYLLALGKSRTAVFVGASVALGAGATTILKQFFSRVRPDIVPHLVPVDTASFPSGHAMNSALVYLTLAMLVARTEDDARLSVYLVVSAVVATLIVGFTRVYLGVHWPSDVVRDGVSEGSGLCCRPSRTSACRMANRRRAGQQLNSQRLEGPRCKADVFRRSDTPRLVLAGSLLSCRV